jgi:hypothetical protein
MGKNNRIFLIKEDGRRIQITEKQAKRLEASPFYVTRHGEAGRIREIRHVQKAARLLGRSQVLSWRQKEISPSCFALNRRDGVCVDQDIDKSWKQQQHTNSRDTGTASKLKPCSA